MIRLITELEFATMGDDWNRLLSQSDNNSIFLTHEWVFVWWQTFQKNKKLFTIAVYNDNATLIGIAPLYIEKVRYFNFLSLRTIKFLGTNEIAPDYLGFIAKSNDKIKVVEAILNFLQENSRQWDIMWLEDIFYDENVSEFTLHLLHDKLGLSVDMVQSSCPFINLPGQFDVYLERFTPKHRHDLRRRNNVLSKNFEYEYGEAKTEEEAKETMIALFELHRSRANAMKRSFAFDSDLVKAFHKQLIPVFFPKGVLKLYYIKLNDKIESCIYVFIYNKCVYFYQSGFNPDFAKFSLGSAIIFNLIRTTIELGCFQLDFLKGNEAYKYVWTQDTKTCISYLIARKKLTSQIYFLLIMIRRNIGSILRKKKKINKHYVDK